MIVLRGILKCLNCSNEKGRRGGKIKRVELIVRFDVAGCNSLHPNHDYHLSTISESTLIPVCTDTAVNSS
jgi:hypothetical protein